MSFLVEALVFLVAALVVVPICKKAGLSSVLGYLGAGVLIGPNGLGLIGDAFEVLHFAEIGVVLLLFIIGLELRPRRLWVMRGAVFGLGTAQVLVSTAVIAALLFYVFALAWPAAVLVGFALALSSTAFVLQLLGEQGHLNHPHGRAAFGVLLLQDVAVIPAIVVLNLLQPSAPGASGVQPLLLLAAIGGLVAARFLLRPMLRFVASTGIHELFLAAGLVIVVGAALAMQSVGLSMGLGAFIAGMMVADSEYRHQLETDITPFKGLLLGLFFIAVGMSADFAVLASSPALVIGLALGLVLVKFLVLVPLALWYGTTRAESVRTAIVLSQGGEFAFVLLTAGVTASVIDTATLEIAVLVITLSMATTPLIASAVDRLLGAQQDDRAFDDIDEPENPVVIAGFGRFAQIVARILTMRHIAFTALEVNPSQVDFVRQFGNEIYFGDATRLDLLQAAHVAASRAFVLAIEDMESSLKVASIVRETCPEVPILARARNREHELRLRELGVQYVIRETFVSSLELAEALLGHLGDDSVEARKTVNAFRTHDARTLERQAAVFHDEAAFAQMTRDAAVDLKELFAEDLFAQDSAPGVAESDD